AAGETRSDTWRWLSSRVALPAQSLAAEQEWAKVQAYATAPVRSGRAGASNGGCKHASADSIAVRLSPKHRGHEAVRACAHGGSTKDQEGAQASFFDLSTCRPRYMPV